MDGLNKSMRLLVGDVHGMCC